MNNNQAQVVLVADINPANDYGDSSPSGLTEFNQKLYFAADDGENGKELWVSDGTAEGTKLVADIRPSNDDAGYSYGSNPISFDVINDQLYFTADDGETGRELWISDGTAEGTRLLADINPEEEGDEPVNLVEFNNKLYFTADDGENGRELWVSDGTTGGTQLLANINSNDDNYGYGSSPLNLTEFNNKLYFNADDGENGRELWVSDGTAEGTKLLADINPSNNDAGYPYGSSPSGLTELNGKLYFAANDGENGRELWVSDGTAEGTELLADINSDDNSYGSNPGQFIVVEEKLYFTADDGENGKELWVSDGTAEGTKLVTDISSSSSNPRYLTELNGKLYFAANDGENGEELWVSDGTAEGTKLVADINSGNSYYSSSIPRYLTVFEGSLYFNANDGVNGRELWVSDGTAEGTKLVADIHPGSNSSDPRFLTVIGDELFFSADNDETGRELYKLTFDDVVDPIDPGEPNEINGTDNNDVLTGTDGSDIIKGFDGRDTLKGGAGDDTLIGNNRQDNLVGGAGNDSLVGGSGDDTLDGGLDNDTLTGNGNDHFVLRAGDGADIITDYVIGSDRLLLADGLTADDLTFSGSDILLGDETLATLNNINASNLRPFNFEEI